MDEDRARVILNVYNYRGRDRIDIDAYVRFEYPVGVLLDGTVSVDELEALAWWMRNKQAEEGSNE